MVECDVIVPALEVRKESLHRLVDSLRAHYAPDVANLIVVPDPPTCGEGWITGLKESTAPYVALIADDLEFTNGTWLEVCKETVDGGGLPCPRVFRPDGGIESQGGDMEALGHILPRPRKDGALTDFTTVPFASREQIQRIGMIRTQYACDVWVSYRGRQLGYETVLRHGYDLIHHQEQAGRGAGMAQNDRDALDTAIMRKALETMEGNPYDSHVEVLRLTLALLRPEIVLELGSGENSTPAILGSPHVKKLISLEDSSDWAARVLERHGKDPRLDLTLVKEVSESIPGDLHLCDLVFIDNGTSEAQRVKAIRTVLSKEKRPPVVIHDAEHPAYADAIRELSTPEDRVTFTGRTPRTAVVW